MAIDWLVDVWQIVLFNSLSGSAMWGKLCSEFLQAQCLCLLVYLSDVTTLSSFTSTEYEQRAASCMEMLDVAGGCLLSPLFDCMKILLPHVSSRSICK